MKKKTSLILSLVFPIVVLAGLLVHRVIRQQSGQEVIIRITGYDPRDLLSGHYLIYRLDVGDVCQQDGPTDLCLSLDDNGRVLETRFQATDGQCRQTLSGICRGGRFEAGVERYFIPEEDAMELDAILRDGERAELKLSVDKRGRPAIKNLLIDGAEIN